jgi:hypothetical protein
VQGWLFSGASFLDLLGSSLAFPQNPVHTQKHMGQVLNASGGREACFTFPYGGDRCFPSESY